jgi:hypothetical protein
MSFGAAVVSAWFGATAAGLLGSLGAGCSVGAAGGGGAARGGLRGAASAGREAQRGGGDDSRDLGCVTQGVLLKFRGADDDIGPHSREL